MAKHQTKRNAQNVKHAAVLRRIKQALQTLQKIDLKEGNLNSSQAQKAGRKFLDLAAKHLRLLDECYGRFGGHPQTQESLKALKEYARLTEEQRSAKRWSDRPGPTNVSWIGHSLSDCFDSKGNITYSFNYELDFWAEKIAEEVQAVILSGEAPPVEVSKEVSWNPNDPRYITVKEAITLSENRLDSVQVNRLCRLDGLVHYMRHPTAPRRRVHKGDFELLIKMLESESKDMFGEGVFQQFAKQAQARKTEISGESGRRPIGE